MPFVVKQLQVKVENRLVVKGMSFKLEPGKIMALMGPNGSGKSSTGYALMGHPDYQVISGQVTLDSQDITHLSPDERAHSGLFLAFQYPTSVEGVRYERFLWEVYQNRFSQDSPRLGSKVSSVVDFRKYLFKLADKLKIDEKLLTRSLNLGFSGGEKKKLEVLQLLVLEPKYAVLDETDSGLDIDAIKVVASGIKLAVDKLNTGVLLITHYRRILDYVKPNKVAVMVNGKIVKEGGVELIDLLEKEGYGLIDNA